jgi:hypothetical protein
VNRVTQGPADDPLAGDRVAEKSSLLRRGSTAIAASRDSRTVPPPTRHLATSSAVARLTRRRILIERRCMKTEKHSFLVIPLLILLAVGG